MVMLSKMINKKQGHEYLIFLQLNFNSDAIFNRCNYSTRPHIRRGRKGSFMFDYWRRAADKHTMVYCTTGPELNFA